MVTHIIPRGCTRASASLLPDGRWQATVHAQDVSQALHLGRAAIWREILKQDTPSTWVLNTVIREQGTHSFIITEI